MNNLSEYIRQLDFAFLKTYSGFNQDVFENLQHLFEQTRSDLNQRFETASPQKQEVLREKMANTRLRWEDEQFDFPEIAGPDGSLLNHAKEMAHLSKEDPVARQIVAILNTPFREQDHWMCPAIYRDSIVFYKADHTVAGIVHICFGCDKLADHQLQFFEADNSIFPQLRSVLKLLGHKVR